MSRAYLRDSGIDFKIRTIELDGKRIKLQIVSRASSFSLCIKHSADRSC